MIVGIFAAADLAEYYYGCCCYCYSYCYYSLPEFPNLKPERTISVVQQFGPISPGSLTSAAAAAAAAALIRVIFWGRFCNWCILTAGCRGPFASPNACVNDSVTPCLPSFLFLDNRCSLMTKQTLILLFSTPKKPLSMVKESKYLLRLADAQQGMRNGMTP